MDRAQMADQDCQAEFRLSFYREIAEIDPGHQVMLVQHTETGRIFVRKERSLHSVNIYETLRQLQPEGVPYIEELIAGKNHLYVIEAFIDGRTVEEILKERLYSEKEAVRTLRAVCAVLRPLHRSLPQIVHRDIKASNVLINRQGKVFLVDFDASRFSEPEKNQDTVVLGTYGYAAPEQFGYRQTDSRTDVYALGVLLNRMVTGQFPQQHICGGPLGEVVKKCTAMDPEKRYSSAGELDMRLAEIERSMAFRVRTVRSQCAESVPDSAASSWPSVLSEEAGKKGNAFVNALRDLPGIRQGKPAVRILYLACYAGCLAMALNLPFSVSDGSPAAAPILWTFRILSFFLFAAFVLYLGNYRGVRDIFPPFLIRPGSGKVLRVVRAAIGVIVIFAVWLLFAILVLIPFYGG